MVNFCDRALSVIHLIDSLIHSFRISTRHFRPTMKFLVLALLLAASAPSLEAQESAGSQSHSQSSTGAKVEYPPTTARVQSPGRVTYFVDPVRGNDANAGTRAQTPWKSLVRVNALKFAPGDRVVIAPGVHEETLTPFGEGSAREPIVIQFLPGIHEFAVEKALRRPYFVSNSCDAPTEPKPIGILIEKARHLRLVGGGVDGKGKTLILLGGRMIEAINDHAEDIAYSGLVFDLKRPTVSEFRVVESSPGVSVIQIAEGSTYSFKDGVFSWTGDIGSGGVMAQQAVPAEGRCWRLGTSWNPFTIAESVEDLGSGKLRLNFKNGYRLQTGDQFQFRHITRDSVGVHNTRSKDILFQDCDFYALTNMGFVSQFTENITYRRVRVAPPKDSLRTCPAWGDIFQFSNCRGEILVEDCLESGMQDDAINCHGTHLRIVGKPAENQFLVRFMQPQTYGFPAFVPGDEIAVIGHGSLRELPGNPRRKVTECISAPGDMTGKDWLISLDGPAPAYGQNDVVDNITWYPNLTARNNIVTMDPVRGYLVTTRGRVVIEGNTFKSCAMSGILVEDDAEGWFESGRIRDMLIRKNRFLGCNIAITPHTSTPGDPVHENIRITDNWFQGTGIVARSVKGLSITGNRFSGGVSVNTSNCQDVLSEDNKPNAKE